MLLTGPPAPRARSQNTSALLGAACGVVAGLSTCVRGAASALRVHAFDGSLFAAGAGAGAGGVVHGGGFDYATAVARFVVGTFVVAAGHHLAKRAARHVRARMRPGPSIPFVLTRAPLPRADNPRRWRALFPSPLHAHAGCAAALRGDV